MSIHIVSLIILLFSFSSVAKELPYHGLPSHIFKKIQKKHPSLLKKPFSQKKKDLLLKMVHKYSNVTKVSLDTSAKSMKFEIKYPPVLSKVEFKGISRTEESKLNKIISLEIGNNLKKELVEESVINIKKYFMTKGFFNAEISASAKNLGGSKMAVLFEISKNTPTKISELKVSSNNSGLNKKLESKLDNFVGEFLSLEALGTIRTSADSYLRENRYLQAQSSEATYEIVNKGNQSFAKISIDIRSPKKYELSFFGNSNLSKSSIIKKLNLDNSTQFFGLDIASELNARIKEIYKMEAFPKTEIQISEIPGNSKHILRIEINEGPQVEIQTWHLKGSFSRKVQYYVDRISKLGSDQIQSENFVESDLKQAIKSLNIMLQNQGYLSSSMEIERVNWIDKDSVEVHLFLEEGPLTKLDKVVFEGRSSFPKDVLLKVMGLTEGGPLNLNKIEFSIKQLKEHYLNNAFLDFEVENSGKDLIKYSDENKKANLVLKLNEGNQIEVKSIIVSGATLTKESVVRKSLAFKKGDLLSLERIKESESQLQKLGIFSNVDISALPANTGKRPVLVKVSERDPGVFTLGLGVSDEQNGTVKLFTGMVYKNLGGSAKVLQWRLEVQKKVENDSFLENKVAMSYLEPFLFGERIKGRTNLSFSQNIDFLSSDLSSNTFIKETKELNFNLEKDFTRHFKFGWKLWGISGTRRFEINNQADTDKLQIASVGPFIELDYRDHVFSPRSGTYSRLNVEYASPALASSKDIKFVRATGAFNHYVPLTESKSLVFAYSMRAGYVENIGEEATLSIPQDKMFFLGGRSTIRGFELSDIPNSADISSLKPSSKNIYYVTDKSFFGLFKMELRFPIYKDFGAAIFYDGGLVEIPEVNIADRYRHSAGIGFRYNTPVGPVSLEYGYKLDKKVGENDGRIHFSIGAF